VQIADEAATTPSRPLSAAVSTIVLPPGGGGDYRASVARSGPRCGRAHNRREVGRPQAGAPDQGAVDLGLGEELGRVGGRDRATVLNAGRAGDRPPAAARGARPGPATPR